MIKGAAFVIDHRVLGITAHDHGAHQMIAVLPAGIVLNHSAAHECDKIGVIGIDTGFGSLDVIAHVVIHHEHRNAQSVCARGTGAHGIGG